MADTANNTAETTVITEEDHSLNTRIFRAMVTVTAVAVIVSSLLLSLRFTAGLLIGGVLAIFSHNWLRNSAGAAINLAIGEGVQQIRLLQFLLRYLVIGLVVFAAYIIDIASITAMLLGLSSFVVALLIEAIREFYFAITQREEN
jgi:ATP synthase I chain